MSTIVYSREERFSVQVETLNGDPVDLQLLESPVYDVRVPLGSVRFALSNNHSTRPAGVIVRWYDWRRRSTKFVRVLAPAETLLILVAFEPSSTGASAATRHGMGHLQNVVSVEFYTGVLCASEEASGELVLVDQRHAYADRVLLCDNPIEAVRFVFWLEEPGSQGERASVPGASAPNADPQAAYSRKLTLQAAGQLGAFLRGHGIAEPGNLPVDPALFKE